MKLKDLIKELDKIFETGLALPQDAVGLQVGNLDSDIKTILLTLDITKDVVDEAVNQKADLVVSHHPLIFSPVSTIISSSLKSLKIIKLLENKIAVYAAHTNFDSEAEGLNYHIAKSIGLKNIKVMEKSRQQWYKFTVFVPVEAETKIRDAICRNGGGRLGNYSCCTFNLRGKGTFKPMRGADPYTGKVGSLSHVDEVRIECVVVQNELENLVQAVIKEHPYEEPAYDIHKIENALTLAGLGRSGEVDPPCRFVNYLTIIKEKLGLRNFRWLACNTETAFSKVIKKVAVINGSANSFTDRLSAGEVDNNMKDYDMILAGELKYHNALEIAENGIILVEIGHGESEKLSMGLMHTRLSASLKKSGKFNLLKSKTGFIPWRYYIE